MRPLAVYLAVLIKNTLILMDFIGSNAAINISIIDCGLPMIEGLAELLD